MGFNEDKATLITLFIESTCYGLFLCLYAISNVILFQRRKERRINTPMIMVVFAMLCFSTLHIGNDIQCILSGFLDPKNAALPALYLTRLNTPCLIIKLISYGGQTLLGDAFLIYRLYVVWRNIWVAIPFIACTFTSAALIMVAISIATHSPDFDTVFSFPFREYPLAFCSLTLVTNAMCTILIAGKIWWIYRKTGGRDLASPMVMIIESGALYSICLVFQISFYASGSVVAGIIRDTLPNIIGLNFSLIIVRVGLGLSAFGPRTSGVRKYRPNSKLCERFASATSDAAMESSSQICDAVQVCQCGCGMTLRALEVHITQETLGKRSSAKASFTAPDDLIVNIGGTQGFHDRV